MPSRVFDEDLSAWQRDGYLVVKQLLTSEEAAYAHRAALERRLWDRMTSGEDSDRNRVRMWMWNNKPPGVFGAIALNERVLSRLAALFGEDVYHFHTKMNLKEPESDGRWEWHQDYDYWYYRGCVSPEMASCSIALERQAKENGCLEAFRGTHRLGRLDHEWVSPSQRAADPARVQAISERMEHVHFELEPGDAVFFHSNILHRSGSNRSKNSRWTMICCYNTVSNEPIQKSEHAQYAPFTPVPSDALTELVLSDGADAAAYVDDPSSNNPVARPGAPHDHVSNG